MDFKINKKQKIIINAIFNIFILFLVSVSIIFIGYIEKNHTLIKFLVIILAFIFIVSILITITNIKRNLNDKTNSDRKKSLKYYIKKNNVEYIESFPDPLKNDCLREKMFEGKENLSFVDVIKKIYSNNTIYIGEIQWSTYETEKIDKEAQEYNDEFYGEEDENIFHFLFRSIFTLRRRRRYLFVEREYITKTIEIKHYQTLGLLYDDSFFLPEFQITNETLKYKTLDLLNISEKDIDFTNDKKFSDKWYLSSIENESIVRELFNNQVRASFSNYIIENNYIIGGKRNMLYIITTEPVEPYKYDLVANHLIKIKEILKVNKKFYKEKNNKQNQ